MTQAREIIVKKIKRSSPIPDISPNFKPFRHHLYLEMMENKKKVRKDLPWLPEHVPKKSIVIQPDEVYSQVVGEKDTAVETNENDSALDNLTKKKKSGKIDKLAQDIGKKSKKNTMELTMI